MSDDIESALVALVALVEAQYPGDAPEKITAFQTAANSYRQLGMPAKAIPLYQRILAIQIATETTPTMDRVHALSDLSTVYFVTERYSDLIPILAEIITNLEQYFPDDGAALYSATQNLASCYLGMGKYQEAETVLLSILGRSETVFKAHRRSIAATHHNLGILYYQLKRYDESDAILAKAVALKKQLWGASHRDVGLTLRAMANMDRLRGRLHSAARLKAEADAILGPEPDDSSSRG